MYDNDETGQVTWALARTRLGDTDPWQFVQVDMSVANSTRSAGGNWRRRLGIPGASGITNMVPQVLRPWNDTEAVWLFAGPLDQADLYTLPAYGDCIWAAAGGEQGVLEAWPLPDTQADRDTFYKWVQNYNAMRVRGCEWLAHAAR